MNKNFLLVVRVFLLTSLLASPVFCHVSLQYPCPRYSPNSDCPDPPSGETRDADLTTLNSPIHSIQLGGTMPLCKHATPYPSPVAEWTAGQSLTVKFNSHAASHSGGHCEFSISYNGKDFAVVHQELRYCFRNGKPAQIDNTPEVLQYTFDLPKDLPSSDKAIFAWTWVNASGNREFYMNCADVSIKGSTSTSYTGKKMTIVNYPNYPTVDEFNMNYETAIDLYTSKEQVTISADGSSTSGNLDKSDQGSASPSASLSSSSATIPGDSTSPTPKDSVIGNLADTGNEDAGNSGSCSGSLMKCSGTGYQTCLFGSWSPVYPCGPGTACKSSGEGAIYCGWP